ncbi:MAG: ABC transporter permease, partial [Anaerolineaceae bacterium]|nr:ABC transporter permease [Anaerolineaceae bacterium]
MIRLARLITLRSILTRRLRTLLSTFGIILGVAGMFAISATNQTAYRSITNMFQNTSGQVTFEIHSADNTGSFSGQVLQAVAGMANVETAVPVIKLQAALVEEEQPNQVELNFFGANPGGILFYGIDPVLDRRIRDYTITSGSFLSNDPDVYETVLVEDFAAEHDIVVRDRIEVQTVGGLVNLRVVGLMSKEGPGQMNQGNFGIISLTTAQKLKFSSDE